jgi:hypothetical protein
MPAFMITIAPSPTAIRQYPDTHTRKRLLVRTYLLDNHFLNHNLYDSVDWHLFGNLCVMFGVRVDDFADVNTCVCTHTLRYT